MTTLERNIYPIAAVRGAGVLAVIATTLALTAPPAHAQCEGVAGAGDEYCETIPQAGGERGAGGPRGLPSGGLPRPTAQALERAGAGAVQRLESPTGKTHKQAAGGSPDPPEIGGDSSTALPYILGALTLLLLLVALGRHLRGSGSPPDPAA